MPTVIKNYLGMIAIAIVVVLAVGAIGVQIDRNEEVESPVGIEATPAISGNAPDGLVDSRWLKQYRSQVDYIFDLSDVRQYESGHIPGAIHIWWQDAISVHGQNYAEPDQISLPKNPDSMFARTALDVPQNARIILYDNNESERASWFLWELRINGYTDVHVLDGGLSAWVGAGGELSTEVDDTRDENLVATPTWNDDILIRREPLRDRLEEGDLKIVDTRSAEEQLDTVNGTVPEGHIPGSINIPTAEVMRADGTFKSAEELRELFASYGIDPDDDVVVYSLFTSQSGNVWLAFRIAGYENVVIYQEGWSGWGRDKTMPNETEPYPVREVIATPASTVPPSTPMPDATTDPDATPDPTPEEGPTDLTGL